MLKKLTGEENPHRHTSQQSAISNEV